MDEVKGPDVPRLASSAQKLEEICLVERCQYVDLYLLYDVWGSCPSCALLDEERTWRSWETSKSGVNGEVQEGKGEGAPRVWSGSLSGPDDIWAFGTLNIEH